MSRSARARLLLLTLLAFAVKLARPLMLLDTKTVVVLWYWKRVVN